jgi:hypothetical protein
LSKQLYDVNSQQTLGSCNLLRRQKPNIDDKTFVSVFCRLTVLLIDKFSLKNLEMGIVLLISNFCRVLKVVCFLLGNTPTSKFYMPTFRNTLPIPSS